MMNFSEISIKIFCSAVIRVTVYALLMLNICSSPAHAAFHEQLAISTRAISLANTCTADPPGIMAIHYNPAGLSLLNDGKTFMQSFTIPVVILTQRLEADPDFPDFLGEYGPNATDEDKRDPLAGAKGTNGPLMYIPIYNDTIPFLIGPSLGLSTRESDSKWTFAVGTYAPYAVGLTHEDDDDPLRYQGKAILNQHLVYAAPTASYQVNDDLSVGLSVGMGQTYTEIKTDMRLPSDMMALTRVLGEATEGLEIPIISELTMPAPWFGGGVGPYDKMAQLSIKVRDDFTPSYNVGLLWSPRNWLSFGLTYQSEIKVEQTGRYSVQHSPQFTAMMNWMSQGMNPIVAGMLNLPTTGEDQYGYCTTTSFNYPQRIQAGLKFQPFKKFKFLFDVNWSDWSIMKEDRFIFDQQLSFLRFANISGYTESPNEMVIKRNFKSTFHWSTGIEIMPLDWLTLRFGYEMRPTSVRKNLYDGIYSLPDLENIGTGLGIKFKSGLELDLAFAYLYNDSFVVPNDSSENLNDNDWTKPVYNPFVGLDYYQETHIYMGSLSMSMPLDMMLSLTRDSIDSVKGIYHMLNPFD